MQDGSTPSFEQFKSIKEKIVKDNDEKQTIAQYQKLEELAARHPGASERIQKLFLDSKGNPLSELDMPIEHTAVSMDHFAGTSSLDFMKLADNPELMKP